MISLKTTLLATAFISAGVLTAAAQSGSGGSMQPISPRAGATDQNISPATHCKTAAGQVQLKSASAGGSASGSASGTSGMGSSSGTSGSASGSGSISGVSPSIVATLPNC